MNDSTVSQGYELKEGDVVVAYYNSRGDDITNTGRTIYATMNDEEFAYVGSSGGQSKTVNVYMSDPIYIGFEDPSTATLTLNIFEETKRISFTINEQTYGSTYDLELEGNEGMTWNEWMNSNYNTSTAITIYKDNSVRYKLGSSTYYPIFYDTSSYSIPQIDDVIEDGHMYIMQFACCFDAGTQILMSDNTTKNIEDVQIGDEVVSYNINTNEFENKKVLNTIINKDSDDLVELEFSNGITVRMRAYHPLLTTNGYKSLRDYTEFPLLEIGDELITKDGTTQLLRITPIAQINKNKGGSKMNTRNNNYIPTKNLRNKEWLIEIGAEADLSINAINRMILKYVEGKSIKEIAYLENVSVDSIEQSLRRSRKKIHDYISTKEEVVPT